MRLRYSVFDLRFSHNELSFERKIQVFFYFYLIFLVWYFFFIIFLRKIKKEKKKKKERIKLHRLKSEINELTQLRVSFSDFCFLSFSFLELLIYK